MTIRYCFLILFIVLLMEPGLSYAKSRSRLPMSTRLERKVEKVIRDYRTGRRRVKSTWASALSLNRNFRSMSRKGKVRLRQLQASLLVKAGYPILATLYASESIRLSARPSHKANANMWKLLAEISRESPVQYILEDLARSLKNIKSLPPAFENDWHYILGNAYWADGKNHLAANHYEKLTMQDRYYMPAQYHLGIIRFSQGETGKAQARLKSIIDPTSRSVTPIQDYDKVEMWNYTNMALGRIFYETKNFIRAAKYYRRVTKTSPLFYDALFEQSWALFMGGSPKHALGSLYGVHSPYYKNLFTPESKVLESMIYFWMCRYDEARNALADFAENHSEGVESLGKYLDRQRLSPESAYQLFENLIAGVSSTSLGIPRNVLQTAAEKDSMLLVRDQYATLVAEIDRLQSIGFFGMTDHIKPQEDRLMAINNKLRRKIGEQFLVELKALKDHYDDLYSQSQFLYLELLMSQKEHLLGRELHANTKVREAASKESLRGWSMRSQSWEDSKQEYWWDEIGYQIIDVEPQCN